MNHKVSVRNVVRRPYTTFSRHPQLKPRPVARRDLGVRVDILPPSLEVGVTKDLNNYVVSLVGQT